MVLEKEEEIACVNSHRNNNSQTLHFGDIETNYTFEKAKSVKRSADLVKHFLIQHDKKKTVHSKYTKMVLAVGDTQVEKLKKRSDEFIKLFPENKFIGKKEIGKYEPNVLKGRDKKENIAAFFSEDGYTIDFQGLAKLFITKTKKLDVMLGTKAEHIEKKEKAEGYVVHTTDKELHAKTVVVASGSHTLMIAKSLGYGEYISLFCVAGSFYFVPKSLNGKVYTMQKEKLPFAAIHGDPDVYEGTKTRFGPTAKAVLLLERHRYKTFFEYVKTTGFKWRTFLSFVHINKDPIILGYVLKNLLYDIPVFGKWLFLKEVRKVVPTTTYSELHYAKGYGGVRPQIVNDKTHTLDMGEAKFTGDNIIFNITPSPGASTCLRNAEDDAKKIVAFLGKSYTFDAKRFEKELVKGT